AATLAQRARATPAVSGGTSPRPFLQTMSGAALDWPRIAETLVDDRWVPDPDDACNAKLVRASLLRNAAAHARFAPLVD
ncbi:6-phosphogluconolactonase, partial [Burkholderia pseudomallei]